MKKSPSSHKRKMQVKTTPKFHIFPVKVANIKKLTYTRWVFKGVKK